MCMFKIKDLIHTITVAINSKKKSGDIIKLNSVKNTNYILR